PQAYFVERVGGAHVEVEVLVGPGQSPHTYEPTPRQVAALSAARVYFMAGVPFEKALAARLAGGFRNLKVVDTSRGIELRGLTEPHGHDGHGDEDEGELDPQATLAPHVWLDPNLAGIQAKTICEELVALDPRNEADYQKNLKLLVSDLDALDSRLSKALAPLKGREFFVFHPAFGYLGAAYGLRQVAVETGGREPSAKRLSALIGKARERGVKVIFVQPQFSLKSAEAVAAAIGGAVVPMDPLARDYISNMEEMAARLREALINK
ncbi:MAG: zinc ABC transporter substrate-binding protein, partial [bacterium]